MKAIIGIVIGLLLSSTISPAADKIRVSGGDMTPLHAIIWVANQEGLFKKHGLDVGIFDDEQRHLGRADAAFQ